MNAKQKTRLWILLAMVALTCTAPWSNHYCVYTGRCFLSDNTLVRLMQLLLAIPLLLPLINPVRFRRVIYVLLLAWVLLAPCTELKFGYGNFYWEELAKGGLALTGVIAFYQILRNTHAIPTKHNEEEITFLRYCFDSIQEHFVRAHKSAMIIYFLSSVLLFAFLFLDKTPSATSVWLENTFITIICVGFLSNLIALLSSALHLVIPTMKPIRRAAIAGAFLLLQATFAFSVFAIKALIEFNHSASKTKR